MIREIAELKAREPTGHQQRANTIKEGFTGSRQALRVLRAPSWGRPWPRLGDGTTEGDGTPTQEPHLGVILPLPRGRGCSGKGCPAGQC